MSVDEKASIQALERTQRPLPLRSGRATRHTHDDKRHGVVDLDAALEVVSGQVTHRLSKRHSAADFRAFTRKVVRAYPRAWTKPTRALIQSHRRMLDRIATSVHQSTS